MPIIYLFYKGRGGNLEGNAADHYYQNSSMSALQKRLDQRLANVSADDEDLQCRQDLLDTDKSLADTVQWAINNKKTKQVFMIDGDEDGYFKIPKVPIGDYRIVARGQAGANDAYWESFITVKAGMATSLKLTSPGKSCLQVD